MKIAEGKTLVILSPGFPADESDTTCLPTIQELVLGIREKCPSLPVTVIAFHYPFHSASYTWKGIHVMAIGGANRPGMHRLHTWWKAWRALKDLNRNGIHGVLSLWYGECSLVGKFFAEKHGLKHFCWLQGQDAKEGNKYVRLTRLKGKELIAMSDFLVAEMQRNYRVKPEWVIPNGIRKTGMRQEKEEEGRGRGRGRERDTNDIIDVIGVGSLIPLKRWHLFIEAIGEAKKDFPQIRAVIVGAGVLKERLQKLVQQAGLEETIQLSGELGNEEVLKLMERSRILLHPSGYEGFGRVCIEALAAGAEVISFCHPVKEPVDGWFIVNTIKEMNEVLRARLLAMPAGNRTIPFDMHDTAEKIIRLF